MEQGLEPYPANLLCLLFMIAVGYDANDHSPIGQVSQCHFDVAEGNLASKS